jgi:hypothetical protein
MVPNSKLAWPAFFLGTISGALKIGYMESKINVAFYFKQLESGNLVGEYFNKEMQQRGTESADIVDDSRPTPNAPYEGKYKSSWWDTDADGSILEIKKHSTGFGIYELTWTNNNQNIFEGIGMLCGDMLIGEYHRV